MILFCSDPLDPRLPDQVFAREARAAEELSLPYGLVDYEVLALERDASRAVRRVPAPAEPIEAIYRGWMPSPTLIGSFTMRWRPETFC